MRYKIKVTQGLKVFRTTVVDVDASNPQQAINLVAEGEVELPSDDKVWGRDARPENQP